MNQLTYVCLPLFQISMKMNQIKCLKSFHGFRVYEFKITEFIASNRLKLNKNIIKIIVHSAFESKKCKSIPSTVQDHIYSIASKEIGSGLIPNVWDVPQKIMLTGLDNYRLVFNKEKNDLEKELCNVFTVRM